MSFEAANGFYLETTLAEEYKFVEHTRRSKAHQRHSFSRRRWGAERQTRGIRACRSVPPVWPTRSWSRHLKFNAEDSAWFDRDRFVLSAGHGSMLIYALLLSERLPALARRPQEFPAIREQDARPSGAASHGRESKLRRVRSARASVTPSASRSRKPNSPPSYNREQKIVDHHTYCIAGDGDLMEGVSSEASSLAGHLQLGKLILLLRRQ